MEKQDADDSAKPQVISYRTPPRPEPSNSRVDALAGIVISGIAMLVFTLISAAVAGGLGALTQNAGVALISLFLGIAAGVWFLHRLAQGERGNNAGLMIGIYIGIGMYLLGIGACAMGVRF